MAEVRKSREWAVKNCGDWGKNPEGIEPERKAVFVDYKKSRHAKK